MNSHFRARCFQRIAPALLAVTVCAMGTEARSPGGYGSASPAEVTAFMQSSQYNQAKAITQLGSNPKRVPLLLGAIGRDPAGPWTTYLHAFCFEAERSAALKESPGKFTQANANALQYLASARNILVRALQASPGKAEIRSNLAVIEAAMARAYADSRPQTNRPPVAATGRVLNARPPTNPQPPATSAGVPGAQNKACSNQLTQLRLAKEMWGIDYDKPKSATPGAAELAKYFPDRKFPTCPGGGKYLVGNLGQPPRCTAPRH